MFRVGGRFFAREAVHPVVSRHVQALSLIQHTSRLAQSLSSSHRTKLFSFWLKNPCCKEHMTRRPNGDSGISVSVGSEVAVGRIDGHALNTIIEL